MLLAQRRALRWCRRASRAVGCSAVRACGCRSGVCAQLQAALLEVCAPPCRRCCAADAQPALPGCTPPAGARWLTTCWAGTTYPLGRTSSSQPGTCTGKGRAAPSETRRPAPSLCCSSTRSTPAPCVCFSTPPPLPVLPLPPSPSRGLQVARAVGRARPLQPRSLPRGWPHPQRADPRLQVPALWRRPPQVHRCAAAACAGGAAAAGGGGGGPGHARSAAQAPRTRVPARLRCPHRSLSPRPRPAAALQATSLRCLRPSPRWPCSSAALTLNARPTRRQVCAHASRRCLAAWLRAPCCLGAQPAGRLQTLLALALNVRAAPSSMHASVCLRRSPGLPPSALQLP